MASVRISEAEWEIMCVVWERAPVSAAVVADILGGEKDWTLTTVRTLLGRLVRKGALTQEEDGKRYLYRAKISQEECTRRETDNFWDRVLGRAPSSTLLHLVRKADLSPKDIAELRKILREKEK